MPSPARSDLQNRLAAARAAMLEAERMLDENIGSATREKYQELVDIAAKAGAEYRLILLQMDQHWRFEACSTPETREALPETNSSAPNG